MQPVILDTDVASLSHKGRLPDPLATRLIGRRPLITFITLGELTKWGTRSRQALADWISGMAVLPGNDAVAVSWAACQAQRRCAVGRGPSTICGSPRAASPMTCPLRP